MFKYYSLLYNRFDKPIIPIAIFSYEDGWAENTFKLAFGDITVLHFTYLAVHLRKQNWRQFVKETNPISAALLSKMGYGEKERVYVKLEFFKILTRLKLDLEKEEMLVGLFEAYLRLNEKEEEIFVQEAKKLDNADEVMELTISYVEKGKEIGRKEGIAEGKEEGKIEVAAKLLADGFSVDKIIELTGLSEREINKIN